MTPWKWRFIGFIPCGHGFGTTWRVRALEEPMMSGTRIMKHPRCSKCSIIVSSNVKPGTVQWCPSCGNTCEVTNERRKIERNDHHDRHRKRGKYKKSQTPEAKAYQKKYRQRPEAKAKRKAYNQTPKRKAYQKKYRQLPEVKARKKAHSQTPEAKAYRKAYYQRPEVKARKKAYAQRPEVKARRKARRNKGGGA